MKAVLILVAGALAFTSQAKADTCSNLTPRLTAAANEVQFHADQVGKTGAALEAAGEANDSDAIRLYASIGKSDLYSAIASVKTSLALLDELEAAGRCGLSKSMITNARQDGKASLAAYKRALSSVIPLAE